ncbi:MAG: MATE family efflux transporter [Oscillibacter sp.]|nr:MATE family efflux transporter [Oscillibacter sp.]
MPTIVMTVFMSLYTMVDGIFVANFVSADALAGLNLVIPGLSVLVALSVLISGGGSVVISRKLGEGKEDEARSDLTFLVALTVGSGILLTVLALTFARPILMFLGATESLYDVAHDYYQVLSMFIVGSLLQVQFQYFFVTAGAPTLGLVCVVAGGVSNVILDYVFIVALDLGIRGAALATGIGYSIPAVVGLVWFAFNRKGLLRFTRPHFNASTLKESVVNGVAGMIINLAGAVVTWLYNRVIVLYLGEIGISAATIVLYARFMFNSVLSGYSSGVAPVISFNYGKQDFEQVKLLFRTSLKAVLAGSVLVLVVSVLARDAIVALFASGDPVLADMARRGILLFSISYIFNGVNTFAATLFSSLSNGKLSAFMASMNTFVFLIGAMFLLPPVGLGADGVWLAVPVAELLSLFLSVYLLKKKQSEYHY